MSNGLGSSSGTYCSFLLTHTLEAAGDGAVQFLLLCGRAGLSSSLLAQRGTAPPITVLGVVNQRMGDISFCV